MNNLLTVLLQGGWGSGQMIMLGGMAIVFYLFLIRPQQKKQKAQRSFKDGMKKGDLVVTIGGIHGRISSMEAEYAFIEVDRGMKIKIDKSAISSESSQRVNADKLKKEKEKEPAKA